MSVNVSSHLEKLSMLLMTAGRSAPRYQSLALIYPQSSRLQSCLFEYFIVVVRLCHHLLTFTQKSAISQMTASLNDATTKTFQADFDNWSNIIKEEVNILIAKRVEDEAKENALSRNLAAKLSKSVALQQKLATKNRVLDYFSTFDYQTPWKQIRKCGNATIYQQSDEYQQWKRADVLSGSANLIVKGKLGSGKSVLLANMVDDLTLEFSKEAVTVCYFFCRPDIPESLDEATIYRSLARQLLQPIADFSLAAKEIDEYNKFNSNAGPDSDFAFEFLAHTLDFKHKAFFILDGLESCSSDLIEGMERLQRLQSLIGKNGFSLSICVSVRSQAKDELVLRFNQNIISTVMALPEENPDIEAFIDARLESLLESQSLTVGEPGLILEIRQALVKGSQGMFLWVVLQLESLCFMKTDDAIRNALRNLPQNLDQTYHQILQYSRYKAETYQQPILGLVAVARRPLTVKELQEALSVTRGDATWNRAKLLNDVYSTLACCGCLVLVEEDELTVRFVHHTVNHFLRNNFGSHGAPEDWVCMEENRMADTIITYLSYGVFERQLTTATVPEIPAAHIPSRIIDATYESSSTVRRLALSILKHRKQPDYNISETLQRFRTDISHPDEFHFRLYALSYWSHHFGSASWDDPIITALLRRLFQRKVLDGKGTRSPDEDSWPLGPEDFVELLVNEGANANVQGRKYDIALITACHRGYDKVVETLLNKGVNVNAEHHTVNNRSIHTSSGSALLVASLGGHTRIVRLLINNGADVKADGGQALRNASSRGREDIVRLLLDKGADVNEGGPKGTALQEASQNGHEQIVRLLLDKGANINEGGKYVGTALREASRNGHEQIVRLLLDKGADVNGAHGDYSGTALQEASRNGYEQIVRLLLDKGADVNERNGVYLGTALQEASKFGYEQIVRLLLDKGADVNAEHGEYVGTALQEASRNGHVQIVRLLLQHDADVNQEGGENGSALELASSNHHEKIVRLLKANGAK